MNGKYFDTFEIMVNNGHYAWKITDRLNKIEIFNIKDLNHKILISSFLEVFYFLAIVL